MDNSDSTQTMNLLSTCYPCSFSEFMRGGGLYK
jgi:hypothetical protein